MNLRLPLHTLIVGLLTLLASCSSWERTRDYGGWSLYVKSGETVSVDAFFDAVQPAFEAVEKHLGPFESDVRVHAWNGGVQMDSGTRGRITSGEDNTISEIPGIGPYRVSAFHARGGGGLFSLSGVFVPEPDVGTAVHELVHARLAEEDVKLPLWFEEGFAMIVGDGAMYKGAWVVDGLACWPWRELRDLDLDDEKLEQLLEMTASTPHDVRDNVLVHFVGWAIVFDLYREIGVLDWRLMFEHYQHSKKPSNSARARIERSLSVETVTDWLRRLEDEDPGVRLAAARGTWKLHSNTVQRILLTTLRDEKDPEVSASVAVNALATAGQLNMGRRQTGWMWRSIFPVLRRTVLDSEEETTALRTLYRAYRYGNSRYDTQAALERLDRFWED